MTDTGHIKTMLNIPSPTSGPPRAVAPLELVIAERDALAAENAQLRAERREWIRIVDDVIGEQYPDLRDSLMIQLGASRLLEI